GFGLINGNACALLRPIVRPLGGQQMTKIEIIQIVGKEVFERACTDLQTASSDPSYGGVLTTPRLPDSNLPHEIADLIWDGIEPYAEKIALFFEIYDDMPGYGHLM